MFANIEIGVKAFAYYNIMLHINIKDFLIIFVLNKTSFKIALIFTLCVS